MRIINVLFQVNYHRHFQRIWKRQGRLQAQELKIPPELREMNIKIINATEMASMEGMCPHEGKSKPFFPFPPSVFHKPKCYYIMNESTQVSESENQVLSLTKTVPSLGLPDSLKSLLGVCALPKQDELVQTNILQAHVWDSDQDKLPRKMDPDKPSYVFKRALGILHKKKVSGLIEKLVYLCDSAVGSYPACLGRDKVINAFCNVAVERNGDSVIFQMPSDILLTSKEPIERFASPSDVETTKDEKVPDIYPIKPVLDLDKVQNKPEYTMPRKLSNSNIHTLIIGQKTFNNWSPTQLLSRAIGTCFAFAAKEAHMKYGVKIKELPHPITVQCMYLDVKSSNFLAYQLNTLELDHDNGIKNQVWIDEPVSLYDEASETNLITNYNPQVFAKLLSLYVNGLHSTV